MKDLLLAFSGIKSFSVLTLQSTNWCPSVYSVKENVVLVHMYHRWYKGADFNPKKWISGCFFLDLETTSEEESTVNLLASEIGTYEHN